MAASDPLASEPMKDPPGSLTTAFHQRLRFLLLALSCGLLEFTGNAAAATTWIVQLGGASLSYNPQFLTIAEGDSVRFANLGGFHNVVADDGSFRCARGCDGDGQGGNGNATAQIWTATVTFPKAGHYGYFCEPHGAPGQGMFGAITVLGPPPAPSAINLGGHFALAALGVLLMLTGLLRFRR